MFRGLLGSLPASSGPAGPAGAAASSAHDSVGRLSPLHGVANVHQIAASTIGDTELARHAQRQSNSTSTLATTSLCACQPPGPGGNGGGDGGGGGGGHATALYDLGALHPQEVVLTLASFAVTKLAYVRVTKAFREAYQRQTGLDVRFRLTFAASGVQARAVIDGLPADLVALALPLDLDKIVAAGLTAPNWRDRHPCNATVCETTVAFVVRQGNPKDIRTWDDLTRPDVQIVLANPKTAGVARWIFLALWGAKMKKGNATALDYVTRVFENVVVQPRDAREASDVFYKQKVGDVLLTYENEVILTNEVYGDKALPYLVPSYNIRIECPLALVDKVVEARGPQVVQAAVEFCKYLFTPAAQGEFAKLGFRVNPATCKEVASQQTGLPAAQLWQVDRELGGWASAQLRFFDAGAILDEIQSSVGRKRADERKAASARR